MNHFSIKSLFFYSSLIIILGCSGNNEQVRGLIKNNAMVVCAHPASAKVGKEIMQMGGNAIDAAVAVQFSLAVTHPSAGNIGGGGFMVLRLADSTSTTLDFREKAPLKAHRDMYLDSLGEIIKNASIRGHLAAGVSGTVDGMVKAHEKYGSLPWHQLVQPAIDQAKNGVILTLKEANGLNNNHEEFAKHNTSKTILTFKKWQVGDTIRHLNLAKTLERIRDLGRAGFYEGETARLIVEEMTRGKGIISFEDLNTYSSKWREPIKSTYRDHTIITMAPPSSGGIALSQLLQMVEPYPLKEYGHNSIEAIHLMTEAERRVYADRSLFLGDNDFYDVPIDILMSKKHNNNSLLSFNMERATSSSEINQGNSFPEHNQTTHFSIIDSYGNAVSLTTTLNGSYGSKVMIGGAGFLINNEMDDFSIKPGSPNMYGLLGGEANAIEPQKRMLSSMTPTIVTYKGNVKIVTGTPGGATIITSVFQSILNVIDHEMTMQEAVSKPRVHSQWRPDSIRVEPHAINLNTYKGLTSKGHTIYSNGSIGRVDAILRLEDGRLEAGADPRGDDAAAGF